MSVPFPEDYANDLSQKVLDQEGRFIGAFELESYLNGASAAGLSTSSAVFQQVAEEYVTRRKQFKKRRRAWRKSGGTKRSLGWIPFKARSLGYKAGPSAAESRFPPLRAPLDSSGTGVRSAGNCFATKSFSRTQTPLSAAPSRVPSAARKKARIPASSPSTCHIPPLATAGGKKTAGWAGVFKTTGIAE